MRGRQVLTMARHTFQEARQRRIVGAVILLGIVFLVIFGIGFIHLHRQVMSSPAAAMSHALQVTNVLLIMGLYVVNFLSVVLAILFSVDTLSGEITSGTIQTVATKPLRRWEIVVGKWLGLAGMLVSFIILMSAAMIGFVWVVSRHLPPNLVPGVALMVLEGMVVLSLSLAFGSRLSTLTNGVVVFLLYGVAFIGGWMREIGSATGSDAVVRVGVVTSFLMPTEVLWRGAAFLMQPEYMRAFNPSPFTAAGALGTAMICYASGYLLAALAIAIWSFERRDL